MEIKELQQGDILLFSAEQGSFISWAITFLTNAPVSHAAMYYDATKQSIIEETPPQIAVNDAAKRFKGRTIHAHRLAKTLPMQPVIDKATGYLNNLEPYDKAGLYTIGLLLIYKKISLNTKAQRVIIRILKKLTASIMDHIHRHKTPGKTPMACSQFVAQCYEDAGTEYQLKFKNSVLEANSLSLLEQAINLVETSNELITSIDTSATPVLADAETLCKELKEAVETNQPEATMDNQLAQAIAEFSMAHATTDNAIQAMNDLASHLSMYIFPGDLLLHCTNTKKVGEIKI